MGNAYSGNDRRKTRRFKVNFAISFAVEKPLRIRGSLENEDIQAIISDISELGMAIMARRDIAVSTRLSVQFMLYRIEKISNFKLYKTIRAKGEVTSNIRLKDDRYRLGLTFKEISGEDKDAIIQFLKSELSLKEIRALPAV